MHVTVQHLTRFEYSQDVFDGVMDVRLGPFSDQHQQWQSFALEASPYGSITRYLDGFGNTAHLIALRQPHRQVEVTTRGTIQTLLADPFAAPRQPPPPLPVAERAEALLPSPLVPPLEALDLLAAPFAPAEPAHSFDSTERLMHFVYDLLAYDQQATDVSTTVAEVLAHRRGVCQDFSHVMLGLCRAVGLPARYVSGYLVSGRGAGASHAWVEVFSTTHGWRGFDPTNNLLASERHVKMAIGRDYRDVIPNRGTYRGAATEHLTVAVEVRAAEDAGAGV